MTKREVAILLIEAAVEEAIDQQRQVIENLRQVTDLDDLQWKLNALENLEQELRDGVKEVMVNSLWRRDPQGEFATILADIAD